MQKIGILGFGFVGQAVYAGIKFPEDNTIIWDPPKGYGNIYEEEKDTVNSTKCIFICLPTPMGSLTHTASKQNTSYVTNALDFLKKIKYKNPVIVKSTVLPRVLLQYQNYLNIVANPEFLNANTAVQDFLNQTTIILGGKIDNLSKVKNIYVNDFAFESKEPIDFIPCSLEDAMNIKYIHNIRHAYEVLFWNYVYEVFENHRKYGSIYEKITGRTGEMYKVASDGKLGYGGACFPKDVHAAEAEYPHELTKFMVAFNKRLRNGKNS